MCMMGMSGLEVNRLQLAISNSQHTHTHTHTHTSNSIRTCMYIIQCTHLHTISVLQQTCEWKIITVYLTVFTCMCPSNFPAQYQHVHMHRYAVCVLPSLLPPYLPSLLPPYLPSLPPFFHLTSSPSILPPYRPPSIPPSHLGSPPAMAFLPPHQSPPTPCSLWLVWLQHDFTTIQL